SIFAFLLMITIVSKKGGLVGTTIFPSRASDRVSINLLMPEVTNTKVTDSIISLVEKIACKESEKYTRLQSNNTPVIENIIKRVGTGNNKASLIVNLLPGEERDFESFLISNNIRDTVGQVYGVERLTYGSGGNFGGSPVSVSLLSNNSEELKQAKNILRSKLIANPLLKDVVDTDPEGIKEIRINLKENA